MLPNPPAGILDPKKPWHTKGAVGERTWNKLKLRLTGGKDSDGTFYGSFVMLPENAADKLIDNLKKDPRGYPQVNITGSGEDAQILEQYQYWLVETYLINYNQENISEPEPVKQTQEDNKNLPEPEESNSSKDILHTIENLLQQQYEKVQNFFDQSPILNHQFRVIDPNTGTEKVFTLVFNETNSKLSQEPQKSIEVEATVPAFEVPKQESKQKRVIRAKGIRNTIKKQRTSNKTQDLVKRMTRAFDRRLEELVNDIKNPTPIPIKLNKPRKAKQVKIKKYNFKPKFAKKSASNFNEFVFNKIGSAFSLAAQARKYAKESGAPEQKRGFFLKKALRHEFGGDFINRTAGTFSSNPSKTQDPALSRGQRFSASLTPFLSPPSISTVSSSPQYTQPSLFDTDKTNTVKVDDVTLKTFLRNKLNNLKLSYNNLNNSVANISSSNEKESESNKNNNEILTVLQKSFDNINKSLKKSNQLNKEENKTKQLSLNLYKDSIDRREMNAEAASIGSTRNSSGTVAYKKADYTTEGILGTIKRFLFGGEEGGECDCEDGGDGIDIDRDRRKRRPKKGPRSRFRIRARLRLARRWASRQLERVKKIKLPKFKMPNIKMPNIRMPGMPTGSGGFGGLLRGAGGLAGKLLRIPLVADMLFPEGTSSYDQLSGPNAYYNAPGYTGTRPADASPVSPKPQAEGSFITDNKSKDTPIKMAEGGTNVMTGEAGPEMWMPQRKAIKPAASPQSSLFSSAGLILGTTSKILRSTGPVAEGTRNYIEQQIGPLAKIFGRPQYNLTTQVGKGISAVQEPKMDTEGGLFGLLKKALKFILGQDEDDKKTPVVPPPMGQGTDFWTLAAIASMEASDPQHQADVAQSVYNRLADGRFGSSIVDILTRENQYEPAFNARGVGNGINPLFKSITDIESAARAVQDGSKKIFNRDITLDQAREQVQKAAQAIQDPSLQQKAAQFVGPYTDFRGYDPPRGGVRRPDGGNYFFSENPSGKLSGAAPIPVMGSASPPGTPPGGPGGTPTAPTRAVGDSLAEGVSMATGGRIKDNATQNLNPTSVNQSLRSAGINRGNTGQVLLSTGLANDPTQRDQAIQQMQYLRSQGIPFTVMPLPTQLNQKYLKEKGLNTNAWLQSVVPQQGGMMAPSFSGGSDGVHATPEEYRRMLNLARLAQ